MSSQIFFPASLLAAYGTYHIIQSPTPISPERYGVSNAASVFKGNSLNSPLLTGPDLINNLVGLLLRFRENPVAISANIEAMIMQVGIIEKDQPSIRFLWPTNHKVKQFQYTRLIFGARCSPSTANFLSSRKRQQSLRRIKRFKIWLQTAFTWTIPYIPSKRLRLHKNPQESTVSLKKTPMRAGKNLTTMSKRQCQR